MGDIHFFNDLRIKAFGDNQSTVQLTAVQHTLYHICMECAEQVSCTEMNPERIGLRCFGHLFYIVLREMVPFFFPFLSVGNAL